MPTSLAVTIVAGIICLAAYAVRRGLFHRALEDTADEPPGTTMSGPARVIAPRAGRRLGIAGTALLAVGLLLGLLTAIAGWGNGPGGTGLFGIGPGSCAQGWLGCPQATPFASAKP